MYLQNRSEVVKLLDKISEFDLRKFGIVRGILEEARIHPRYSQSMSETQIGEKDTGKGAIEVLCLI